MKLPQSLHVANEGFAFLLELVMLAILGWWGATRSTYLPLRIAIGAAAPIAAAIVWGLFAAPKAKFKLPMAGVLVVKALVFGTASAALWSLGRHSSAIAFGATTFVNTALAAFDRKSRVTSAG